MNVRQLISQLQSMDQDAEVRIKRPAGSRGHYLYCPKSVEKDSVWGAVITIND